MNKFAALMKMGKPSTMLVMTFVAFAGALFSPNFYSDDIPSTLLSTLFGASPQFWSIANLILALLIVNALWIGTALFNDYYDIEIDRDSSPHRPLIRDVISGGEVLSIAALMYLIALILVFLHGNWVFALLVILSIFLGFQYSAPPMRLRRWGVLGTLIIGIGVASAFLMGSASQYALSNEGIAIAIILGIVTFANASVKDFKDIEADKKAGVKSMPIIFGYETAVKAVMAWIAISYLFLLAPYLLNYLEWTTSPGILLIGIVNLIIVKGLLPRRTATPERVYTQVKLCGIAVVMVIIITKLSMRI